MTRSHALNIFNKFITTPSLKSHCLSVGYSMEYYAKDILKLPEEESENWFIAGLLHDLDWEMFPDYHPAVAIYVLEKLGLDKTIVQAINSHTDILWLENNNLPNEVTLKEDVFAKLNQLLPDTFDGNIPTTIKRSIPRIAKIDKFLFACDELSGFVIACARVRPNKLQDLEVKSVQKRLKEKSFAAGVNRDDVYTGANEISEYGIDTLDIHIQNIISALKSHEAELL